MRLLSLAVLAIVLVSAPRPVLGEVAGAITIAGNGPESIMIEKLARAFEKAHPRAYVDIQWNDNSKPLDLLKSAQAQVVVAGKEDAGLRAARIGWDGIAVVTHISNSTREITTAQAAQLFSGKIKTWAELGGSDTLVLLLDRPKNRNIRDAFEQQLGITGQIPDSAQVVKADDKAIKTVVGTLPPMSAATFVSLGTALEAVASGVAIRVLQIDKVEAEEPTVKDGRYKLRRPVLLLSTNETNPVVDALVTFALSPAGQQIVDTEGYTPLEQKK